MFTIIILETNTLTYEQLPHPVEKRSAAIAIINTTGNMAQIYSPYFYLPQNGPQYVSAMVANVCFCMACIAVTWFLRKCLRKENVRIRRKAMSEEGIEVSNFRYVL